MSFDVLNPLMLLGLAGVALPVLAHLLSRKKYDIVQWGAMQFLELGRDARRKIRLEEILLMLVRMGLIALVAIALSRPWAQGGYLANLVSTQPRDVVIVIDGSYSMGWEGRAVTPHAAAIQWAHDFLEDLRPGDTVALLDARDHVRPVIESPTRDFKFVREQLTALPPPSGSSNLADAVSRGVQILSRTSNLARDVLVLTDGQARGWRADDDNLWTRIDDLRTQPSVQPRVWVVDVEGKNAPARTNFSLERLELSRELTVPGFPIRVQTKVRASGGREPVTRSVHLEADGQRLSEKSLQVQLPPNGEASVEFEHRFTTPGSHVLSVVLDEDNLPGDNRSDAAVSVAEALPVLLVDGTPHLDATRTETFFAAAALTASSNETPWVRATVVPFDRLDPAAFHTAEAIVLANVPKLTDAQVEALKDYVAGGGGLFIAAGDGVEAEAWNAAFFEEGRGLLPASFVEIDTDESPELQGVRVVDESLELTWMAPFRSRHGGGFTEARFTQWWKLAPAVPAMKEGEDSTAGESRPPLRGGKLLPPRSGGLPSPVIAARLNTGDPLLVTRRYGRGSVAQLAAPLDADWSTLPAKSDFVPLLHEVIFHLASGRASRNVDVGLPLVQPVPRDFPARRHAFFGPGDTEFPVTPAGDELRPLARLDDTRLPGIYTLRSKSEPPAAADLERPEHFVVNADRDESDLTPLDDVQRATLTRDDRITFIATHAELQKELLTDTSRVEFWHLLLLLFLGILVFEVVMTRRLVQGGHEAVEPEDAEEFETTDAHR